jgi:predicted ATPase
VAGWLGRSRLVTLLGSGGVGKTRLSIAVAEAILPQFEDGVWFVDLAPLNEASLVAETTAKALGVSEQAGLSPEELLTRSLEERSLLLVLDNCEHLLDACASLAFELLSACPHLRILATSRQALGITGEHLYRVPSLSLPPEQPNVEKSASALLEFAAIRLFVERARQANPSFQLTRSSAEFVRQICQQLDGIPLAIEMAAARVKSLSVTQIAARLEDRFALLTGGNRAALPRQRTLQAAIDWSYDLLSEAERVLCRRLCVFVGGWSLEAAEAVCAGEGITQGEVLDVLTQLVEKSLVVFEEAGAGTARSRLLETRQQGDSEGLAATGEARYRLLETVRQYAQDRLRESEENTAVRGRHRDYFTAFAEEARRGLIAHGQLAWSQRLEIEHDNIRGAIAWCQDDPGGVETGLRLTSAMGWFWETHGYLSEGRQHLAEALARDSRSRTKARGDALIMAAQFAYPDYAAAQPLYEENLALQRELKDRLGIAVALTQLGLMHHELGDPTTALAYLEQSLTLQQEAGDRQSTATTIYWLGCIAEEQGDLAKARVLVEEAYRIDLEYGHRAGHAAWRLGDVLCMQGDYAGARARLMENLRVAGELGDKFLAMSSLEYLAWLASLEGDNKRAACLYGAAAALRTTFGYTFSPADQNKHLTRSTTVRVALGDATFTTAWEQGQAMSLEQTVEYALA